MAQSKQIDKYKRIGKKQMTRETKINRGGGGGGGGGRGGLLLCISYLFFVFHIRCLHRCVVLLGLFGCRRSKQFFISFGLLLNGWQW